MKKITLSGLLFLISICCQEGAAVTKRIESSRNSPHHINLGDIRITILDIGYSDEDQFDETEIVLTLVSDEIAKTCEVVSFGNKIKSFTCRTMRPEEDSFDPINGIHIYFDSVENETAGNVKSILAALTYNDSLRLDVYFDGEYIVPNNAETIQDIFRLHSGDEDWNLERHIPRLESEINGENYFIKNEKIVFVLLHQRMELVIQPIQVLDFSLVIPYPKDEFDEYFAIESLLILLKLPKEYLTIVGAECRARKKSQSLINDTYLLLQVEVGSLPRLTPGDVRNKELDLKSLSKNLTAVFQSGDPVKWFSNSVYFLNIENDSLSPERLVNCSKVRKRYRRESDADSLPAQSEDSIEFEGHKLVLRPASNSPPYDAMAKETLLPAPGVLIFDETTQEYASGEFFKDVTWSASIKLKYDFYIGELKGTTGLEVNDNHMILFEDLNINTASYSHYLLITVGIKGKEDSQMTYTIGPFNVRLPGSIQYKDYTKIKFKYAGDYNKVVEDEVKFAAFMPNFYGKIYSDVDWEYLGSKSGSVMAEMKMTGSPENLKEQSKSVKSDKKPLPYEKDEPWSVQNVEITESSLNVAKREAGTADGTESSTEDGGDDDEPEKKSGIDTLPAAWIAAIVINGILVLLFIGFVIYCYCKSKKRSASSVHMMEKSFDGPPDRMYNEKAANLPGNEKAALLDHSVFTVEDEKRRMEDDDADRYSTPINGRSSSRDPRCTCGTPECCCGQRETSYEKRYTTPPMTVRQEYPEPKEEEPINYGEQRQNEDPWNPPMRTYSAGSRNALNDADYLPGAISPIDEPEEPIIPPPPPGKLPKENHFSNYSKPKPLLIRRNDSKKKPPPYVGPLGICGAMNCENAARIKCLDCGNIAYCGTRCMRLDLNIHRKSCFKQPWRI